ncbi:MAG: M1 family peptidase [Ignavibacteria bacterium]|nr:M1 family peptidase [Ignavibacteria bacterium]
MKIKHYFLFVFLILSQKNIFADNYPRNYSIDIIHYSFKLNLFDNTDEIIGSASISILFKKNDIKQVRLDLINKSEQRQGMGMSVESVTCNNQSIPYTHTRDELIIQVATLVEKDKILTFVIQYKGKPADGLKIGPTKFGDRSFFCENWPNRTRHWLPTVDHPYDKATSEFIVKAPAHYKVVSNGLLIEESMIDQNTKLTHWKQSVPVSCWLFVLGVAEFAVQYVDDFNGKSIQTWVYPKDREAGFYDFAEPTKQTLQFYSDYVGPYVYEKLANIQSPSVGGGMETSSAIFYGENLINGKRTERLRNIVIHEVAHQWFGNAITESTWDDAWLSEGFATYFTLLFIENAYGYEEYLKGIKNAKKSVYDYNKKDSTFSIVSNRTAETDPVTSSITYQKGAWVLHMLRDLIGHENFRKGIQAYYKKFMNLNVTTGDFIDEMEKVSSKNLKPFFNQWLNNSVALKIKGSWDYDATSKNIIIKLQQTQSSGFIFDVPVEIVIYDNGAIPKNLKYTLNTKQAEYRIPAELKPNLILLDPRAVLLAEIDFN